MFVFQAPAPAAGGGDAAAMWIAQAKAENDSTSVNAVSSAAVSYIFVLRGTLP